MEFVGVSVLVPPGQTALVALYGMVNGVGLPFGLPLTFVGTTASFDEYRAMHQVRMYHDGNGVNGPSVGCLRSVTSGAATCGVTISVYLKPTMIPDFAETPGTRILKSRSSPLPPHIDV